jgi:hypothetical protein
VYVDKEAQDVSIDMSSPLSNPNWFWHITMMTLTQRDGIILSAQSQELAMKNASYYRALASLYCQQAAYNPAQSWHLLGQAQRWEHLAEQEVSSHFEECNANRPVYSTKNQATAEVADSRWKAIVAA